MDMKIVLNWLGAFAIIGIAIGCYTVGVRDGREDSLWAERNTTCQSLGFGYAYGGLSYLQCCDAVSGTMIKATIIHDAKVQ